MIKALTQLTMVNLNKHPSNYLSMNYAIKKYLCLNKNKQSKNIFCNTVKAFHF
jgi:hypothetical protein